jgi:hypothetical protein
VDAAAGRAAVTDVADDADYLVAGCEVFVTNTVITNRLPNELSK